MMILNKKKLVTHNGSFHTDDIFAAATLSILLERKGEDFEIIRTRDEEIIKTADYVFDVGGIYDRDKNRFDHHQVGGAGKNKYGIEYSSFGLVWEKFGAEFCGSQKAADIIDKKLAAPVDAHDNGVDLIESKHEVYPYFIQWFFFAMVPTWREEDVSKDEMFFQSVEIAKKVLLREAAHAQDFVLAEDIVRKNYSDTKDKRIIIWDKHYPSEFVLSEFPEPLFVIYPRNDTNTWGVKTIRDDIKSFKDRKSLPSAWAGLRDAELQNITGVIDAIFCHRALFMAVVGSKENAIKLAEIALTK